MPKTVKNMCGMAAEDGSGSRRRRGRPPKNGRGSSSEAPGTRPANGRAGKGKRALPAEEEAAAGEGERGKQQAPRKKTRRKQTLTEKDIEEEKTRLLPFVPKASPAIRERISRAFAHRLYLIDKKLHGGPDAPSSCNFFVLGATGNVYTVALDLVPSCTCPDFAKGNTCKHILFVMLRVLKLPRTDHRVWQKALLPSEFRRLIDAFSITDQSVVASGRVQQQFRQIIGTSKAGDAASKQREVTGDCPVCYEAMARDDGKPLEPVVFCKSCGNNVHMDCFRRWSETKARGEVTCIYCRAQWDDGKQVNKTGGYVNLASYSDAHASADVSFEALYPGLGRRFWLGY